MANDRTILAKLGYGLSCEGDEEDESPWARLRNRKSLETLRKATMLAESATSTNSNIRVPEKLPVIAQNSAEPGESVEVPTKAPLAPRLIDIVNRLHQTKIKQGANKKKEELTQNLAPTNSLQYGKYRKAISQYDDVTTLKNCQYLRLPERYCKKGSEKLDIDDIFSDLP